MDEIIQMIAGATPPTAAPGITIHVNIGTTIQLGGCPGCKKAAKKKEGTKNKR